MALVASSCLHHIAHTEATTVASLGTSEHLMSCQWLRLTLSFTSLTTAKTKLQHHLASKHDAFTWCHHSSQHGRRLGIAFVPVSGVDNHAIHRSHFLRKLGHCQVHRQQWLGWSCASNYLLLYPACNVTWFVVSLWNECWNDKMNLELKLVKRFEKQESEKPENLLEIGVWHPWFIYHLQAHPQSQLRHHHVHA